MEDVPRKFEVKAMRARAGKEGRDGKMRCRDLIYWFWYRGAIDFLMFGNHGIT